VDDPIAQPGELSADHRQYWDGQRWLDTLSPDGRWRWDGALWQLAETGEGHRAGGGDELGAVVVSFELGYSEARDALRWVLWHNWKLLAAPICSALLVGVGVSLLGTQTGLGLFAMLVGVYLIGIHPGRSAGQGGKEADRCSQSPADLVLGRRCPCSQRQS
jgi:hypothetical protein